MTNIAGPLLKVKRLSANGKLPLRGSPGAAGYDLFRYGLSLGFNFAGSFSYIR